MRNLLVARTRLLVAAGLVTAVALAVPRQTAVTTTGMPMAAAKASGMKSGTATPTSAKLTIQHAQNGCHVWSNGTTTAAMMRVHLKHGQRLTIVDMDVDAHQMMQFSGLSRLHMGGPTTRSKSVVALRPQDWDLPGQH